MNAEWTVLTDAMWARVEPVLPGQATDPGVTAADNRRFRTGSPWRDLPERFGNWNSVFRRFRRWAFSFMFSTPCQRSSTSSTCSLTAMIVQAHRKASGARGTGRRGIGRSLGDLTGKIVAVVDALGCLVRNVILPGRAHDSAAGARPP